MYKLIFFLTLLPSTNASAYLGPGMGGGIIMATIGIIIAIIIGLISIIWFPIKRLLDKKKLKSNDPKDENKNTPNEK